MEALLEADPELRSRLGAIEAALRNHFGPGAKVERQVNVYYDCAEGDDDLCLRVSADLSLDEKIDRLQEFLRREGDLVAPVVARFIVGIL